MRKGKAAEELAFSVQINGRGMDVVRVTFANSGPGPAAVEAVLSGKRDNLPAVVRGSMLSTRDGYVVAMAESETGAFSPEAQGYALVYRTTVPAHSSQMLVLKRPYDFLAKNASSLKSLTVSDLLRHAVQSWQEFWGRGIRIHLPEKEIDDFFYSSLAYVVILTEHGPHGGLWTMDGPGEYRQYWGRGEYFQARSIEVSGYLNIAGETAQHALGLERYNGEWAWPAISGWPAWDNIGGEAGAVWDYYLFTRDQDWLRQAYPYLLAAAHWIRFHREETELPADPPPGSIPIKRQIPGRCRKEPNPPLGPGEKPYWWGLLPWGYGDSGLPQGHNFPANIMALYAVKCAWHAAEALGHPAEAKRLAKEYSDYRQAILTAIHRSVKLEKEGPPYLPAMPTFPRAAVSQSFEAVYPTAFFSPDNPLITGLLTRVERSELQGLPSNMAWMGPSGVWPGESMNVAETYLRRGEVGKTVNMLIAALNHSYTTDVWKEEIRVDYNLPVACTSSHIRKLKDQVGTGDMPEAWANANLVNLVRDMLLHVQNHKLLLLSGIPADWISVGEYLSVQQAPTTLGKGLVSFRLTHPQAGRMVLDLTLPPHPIDAAVRFPIAKGRKIVSAEINGQPSNAIQTSTVMLHDVRGHLQITITFN